MVCTKLIQSLRNHESCTAPSKCPALHEKLIYFRWQPVGISESLVASNWGVFIKAIVFNPSLGSHFKQFAGIVKQNNFFEVWSRVLTTSWANWLTDRNSLWRPFQVLASEWQSPAQNNRVLSSVNSATQSVSSSASEEDQENSFFLLSQTDSQDVVFYEKTSDFYYFSLCLWLIFDVFVFCRECERWLMKINSFASNFFHLVLSATVFFNMKTLKSFHLRDNSDAMMWSR